MLIASFVYTARAHFLRLDSGFTWLYLHIHFARFVCLATFDVNIVQHFVFKVTKTELFHFYCFASGRCVCFFFVHHSFLLELIGRFGLSIWFSVARLRQSWMRLRRDFPISGLLGRCCFIWSFARSFILPYMLVLANWCLCVRLCRIYRLMLSRQWVISRLAFKFNVGRILVKRSISMTANEWDKIMTNSTPFTCCIWVEFI